MVLEFSLWGGIQDNCNQLKGRVKDRLRGGIHRCKTSFKDRFTSRFEECWGEKRALAAQGWGKQFILKKRRGRKPKEKRMCEKEAILEEKNCFSKSPPLKDPSILQTAHRKRASPKKEKATHGTKKHGPGKKLYASEDPCRRICTSLRGGKKKNRALKNRKKNSRQERNTYPRPVALERGRCLKKKGEKTGGGTGRKRKH